MEEGEPCGGEKSRERLTTSHQNEAGQDCGGSEIKERRERSEEMMVWSALELIWKLKDTITQSRRRDMTWTQGKPVNSL